MKFRVLVFYLYCIGFFVSLIGLFSVPSVTTIYGVILGFCGVLIAYWVVDDEEEIKFLKEEINSLKDWISNVRNDLEEEIRKLKET